MIDDLQSKLILRLGRKISQQETLDLCMLYANKNFEDILSLASDVPSLSPAKAEEIIQQFEEFKGTPYNKKAKFPHSEDEEIYSL